MYKNILLAVDLNEEESWKKALPVTLSLCDADTRLHVITVVPSIGMSIIESYFPENYQEEVTAKVLNNLKAFVADNLPDGIPVQRIVGSGNVYESILQTADEISADLIVMAAHRVELENYLLGPNAARVVRHANISVLVVR